MTFIEQIEERLQSLNLQQVCQFAWVCGVRALPFLSIRKSGFFSKQERFSYWKPDERQKYLYSLFYGLDICLHFATFNTKKTSVPNRPHNYIIDAAAYANTDAAKAAYAADAAAKAAYANAYANTDAVCAAYANANAAKAADAAAKAAYANTDAAKAAKAATYAATYAAKAAYASFNMQNILLDDLDMIRKNRFEDIKLDVNVDKYSKLWKNFQLDLNRINCGYWADLYANLFNNGLRIIDTDELLCRLSLPREKMEEGAADVAAYLVNAKKQGSVYIQRETRLIILGSAGAGKTTLTRRLKGDMSYPEREDTTHGVDTSTMLNFDGTKARVWDFGGQVIYHSSHRCFMSANCVYILVVDARNEANRDILRINYWLDTIRVYSDNKAKVFIVINESDNRKQNAEDYNSFKAGEYGSMIQEIYSFNIGKDVKSLSKFKDDLGTYVKTVGHQVFGKNDSAAMKDLKDLFDKKTKVLTINELNDVLTKNGISNSEQQKNVKVLFNTLGVALSYDFMEGYVLDPYWISHGVYKIVDYLQTTGAKFVNYSDLARIFADEPKDYPADKRNTMLDMMAYHKIGFWNKKGVQGLFVPCATSLTKPSDVIVDVGPDFIETQVERADRQELPADFFYRYVCDNKDDIKINGDCCAVWQTGMVLVGECANALVELKDNRWLKITVWGARKEEYKAKLETLINVLIQDYQFTTKAFDRPTTEGKLVKCLYLFKEIVTAVKTVTDIAKSVG